MERPIRPEATTPFEIDIITTISGPSTNGEPSFRPAIIPSAPIRKEQFADPQHPDTSHHFGTPSFESPSSSSITASKDQTGSQVLSRSPSYRSKGKMRADQIANTVQQSTISKADTQHETRSPDHRFFDAIEGQSTEAAHYPGPPPAEPPPLPPLSPFRSPRSPTRMKEADLETGSNHQAQQSRNRDRRDTTELTHIGSSESYPEQTGLANRGIPAHGTASPTETPAKSSLPQSNRRPSSTVGSSISVKSPSRSRNRIPSKEILQTALNLAQQAVQRDKANDIPGAMSLYRDAVARLRTVMGRVGLALGPLSPDLGIPETSPQEKADRVAAAGRRATSGAGQSAEEGKTLMGIHDAYVARIRLLTQINGDVAILPNLPSAGTSSAGSMDTLSPYFSPAQSAFQIVPSGTGNESGLGTQDIVSASRSDNGTQQVSEALPNGSENGRLGTILTEARPPITQRAASLSAYSRQESAAVPSPSLTFGCADRPQVDSTTSDSALLGKSIANTSIGPANLPTGSPISMDIVDSRTPTLERPVPSRPARNPLRSPSQPVLQGNEGAFRTPAVGVDPDSQIIRVEEKSQLRERRGSDSSIRTFKVAPSVSTSTSDNTTPLPPAHYPFYVLRQIRSSMTSPLGAPVIQGLYVPRAAWSITGIKLPALDTKIRVMVLLSQSLNTVMESGRPLLQTGESDKAVSADSSSLKQLAGALDDLEALTMEIQKLLAKKVGDGKAFAKPRKSNSTSISNWGSKFSKTFDKMMTTTGKSLESTVTYNECLTRLCADAQCIDLHLSRSRADPIYFESRTAIQSKLVRISGFFADVILRFVLQDLSLLLSKHIRQGGRRMLD